MAAATKSTASKTVRKSSKFKSYDDVRKYVDNVPLAKRRELAIGRDGAKVKPRGYHLNDDKIAKIAAAYKESGNDLNILATAYNKGNYHYIIAALFAMGVDEQHPKSRVFNKMKTLMSAEDTKDADGKTAFERFENKDPRSDGGLDVDGRFDQNIVVLQRLTGLSPYGYKLLQVLQEVGGKKGGVIDVLVAETGTEYLRLNTKSASPINQTKKRGMGSPAAIAAEKAAAKAARKGKDTKAKSSKPKATKSAPAETVASTEVPAAEPQTAEATA